ncbi:MAG: glycosyltransferase family 4 protein, partial [Anaerolineales bacterium]|nr:glycosyltransferase family 4 protein [Anaerolineales bacterium]
MKIALVTPYDYPYPGGVTEHIMQLDREFRRRGYDTRIIAASSQDTEPLQDNVIKVSGAVSKFNFSGSNVRVTIAPQLYQRVKRILLTEKFDIVHAHEPAAPLLCPIVLRHSHAVNVGTFHAYRETNTVYQMARPLLRPVYKKLDGRIFVSQAVRDFTVAQFPGEYRIIPNGIDFHRFANPNLRPIEQYDDGRPNILFVGRLDKRKGFRDLIRAFPYIKREIPDARLLVVGAYDDKDKAPFIRYARTQRLRGIHFVGYVSREMLPRYYRTADLFCAPSTGFESFGIVLLEAMAAGLPIVASDIAGYRQVLTDRQEGRLVAPEDPEAIARAAIALLS